MLWLSKPLKTQYIAVEKENEKIQENNKKSVDFSNAFWYINWAPVRKGLEKGARTERRAPCKLNNVKEHKAPEGQKSFDKQQLEEGLY